MTTAASGDGVDRPLSEEPPGPGPIALTTDTSTLTAVGNDFGFEQLFSRQIEALCGPGDVA
jgi:D-sedoheptulose 7-phosphate isomerase